MNKASIKTRLITALLSVTTATCFAQQDIQFSQYMFNPLVLNTAYAGYRGESYANFMYRKQWVDLKGAPETFAASVEWLMPNQDERVAWSAKVLSDKLGPQKTTSAFLGYTYRVPLDEYGARRLCFGLSGGVTQYSVDGNAFQYVDNNDDLVPVGVSSKVTPDFNAGAYYYTPKFYFSAGVNNLLAVKAINSQYNWQGTRFETMEKRIHGYFGSGLIIPLSDAFKFRPSFLWKEDFNGPSNFDFNAYILIKDIVGVGATYRTGLNIWNKPAIASGLDKKDAYSFMFELYAIQHFRIGYAYDVTTSKLASYENGTHEISIGIGLPAKDKRVLSPRYF